MIDVLNELIIALHERGFGGHGVASLIGVSPNMVRNRLKKAGYVLKKPNKNTLCVHHINGDHSDNHLENLQIMSFSKHTQLHNTKVCSENQTWCSSCQECLPKINFFRDKNKWNGLANFCKDCIRRKYGGRYKEYHRDYQRKYRAKIAVSLAERLDIEA